MTGVARSAVRLSWIAPVLFASAASAANEADIHALIDSLRPVGEAIVVDGNPADWGAIPAFPDPSGDEAGDPSRDVTSVRIAPTASALYVLIQTAGAPSAADWAFWIRFDFLGWQFDDVVLAINHSGDDALSWAPEGGCISGPCSAAWEHATVAVGSAVEIKIPYAQLDAVLPAAMQGKLTGSGARPFVRVRPDTVDYPPPSFLYTEIDEGAAVGSYRLVPTPYALDSALPPGGSPFTALANPLPGLWYIGQGAFTNGSHTGYWGYDLNRVDNALHWETPVGSTNLADNLSFGQMILAPAAGTAASLASANPDQPIGQYGPDDANFLWLEIPGNMGVLLTHLKQGSIPFAPGASVAAGALAGRVGNSGYSGWPHLHLGADTIPAQPGGVAIPLGITNANVGLNPTANDPWRRTVASWGIREGYFVLPEPDAELVFVAGVALLALLSQLRRVRALSGARARRAALHRRRVRP